MRIHLLAILGILMLWSAPSTAQTIEWLDWSSYPIGSGSGTVISHPVLGDVQVTTSFEPQATFAGAPGSLGGLSWGGFSYINFDGSSTGTNSAISAVVTLSFLDGPIDLIDTRLFVTTNGLAEFSTYLISGEPTFLGTIGVAEGIGSYVAIGDSLQVTGAGFNHDPDLLEVQSSPISSVQVTINQVLGDGTGFTIGASAQPTVPALRWTASVFLVACLGLLGATCVTASRRRITIP